MCGDIFVVLMNTNNLYGWGQKRISKGIIPDRHFYLGDKLYYLEAEMGNQREQILKNKVAAYKEYFRQTKEAFNVLFVMAETKDLVLMERVLAGEPVAYEVLSFDQLKSTLASDNPSK